MASETQTETQASELSSLSERLLRHRDLSVFLPFILGFNTSREQHQQQLQQEENMQDRDQETPQATNPSGERIILINPFTQGMVMIEGTSSLDSLLQNLATATAAKDGHPPASKASIEAMPSVEVSDEDSECVICLEDWEAIDDKKMAKEMPCKHRFHEECIKRWLGIHGSCPVCRYKMPIDEGEIGKKRDDQERRREIWVSFSFNRRSGEGSNNQTTSSESIPTPHHEMEG